MSTDAPFTPPKKKPNVLWWLGGGFVLLVFVFILQLFGPNPPIVVSPQTTYITTPLGAERPARLRAVRARKVTRRRDAGKQRGRAVVAGALAGRARAEGLRRRG